MKIEVAVSKEDTTTDQGNLLESFASKLLKLQGYYVSRNIRVTGLEIDLLCEHSISRKQIYVECKAYKSDNKIQADIIKKIVGVHSVEEYSETWLISTSEFGKDAKGYANKIKDDPRFKETISFYTPENLIASLVHANLIISEDVARFSLLDKTKLSENVLGMSYLLITKYGDFVCCEKLVGGEPKGVFVLYAQNGELVVESQLLENLAKLESSLKNLNFLEITPSFSGNIRFSDAHLSLMNEMNIKFTHPNKGDLFLSDVFVYPDLELINSKESKYKNASDFILEGGNSLKWFVFGDETSGKTSLAYMLQKQTFSLNNLPVYFDLKTASIGGIENINLFLIKKAKQQYVGLSDEKINQMIIFPIFDNYHLIKLKPKDKIGFLNEINKNYNRYLILSNSSSQLEVVTNADIRNVLDSVEFLRISEYGYKLRDQVIEKWLSVGTDPTIYDNNKHQKIMETAKIIDTTVGKSFIPTYPIYLLTLLQSIEASANRSLQGSAYSEYYNFLITQALTSSNVKAEDLDFYYALISDISYYFFNGSKIEISETELATVYKNYCEKKIIDKPYKEVLENIVRAKIINFDGLNYNFAHNYIYYFFVAKYLADYIDEDFIKNDILEMVKKLYVTEFANIIIFLVHYSKRSFVLDSIMNKAISVFSDISPASLTKDEFKSINELIEDEVRFFFEDKDVVESRKEELEIKDKIEKRNSKREISTKDKDDLRELDIFGQLNLAIKIMRIIGQISKNYYGSLDGDIKLKTINEVYSLGLRALNSILNEVITYQDVLEDQIHEIIKKKSSLSEQESQEIVRRIIFDFVTMLSFGFVSVTGSSISSKELEIVYKKVIALEPNSDAKKLISLSASLDFASGFNVDNVNKLYNDFSGNHIARTVLKLIVMKHLYKFDHDYDKKRKICDMIGISLEKQQNILMHNARKMLNKR